LHPLLVVDLIGPIRFAKENSMFSLIRLGAWQRLLVDEGLAFVVALAIAEVFFRFHSFILESTAFLAVWYALGAVTFSLRRAISSERK
jgi:hypothetical protein